MKCQNKYLRLLKQSIILLYKMPFFCVFYLPPRRLTHPLNNPSRLCCREPAEEWIVWERACARASGAKRTMFPNAASRTSGNRTKRVSVLERVPSTSRYTRHSRLRYRDFSLFLICSVDIHFLFYFLPIFSANLFTYLKLNFSIITRIDNIRMKIWANGAGQIGACNVLEFGFFKNNFMVTEVSPGIFNMELHCAYTARWMGVEPTL